MRGVTLTVMPDGNGQALDDIMTSQEYNDIMEQMGVAEAKRRFSELIDRVARGERFVVTRRGSPVVVLGPWEPDDDELPPGRRRHLLEFAGILEGLMTDEEVDEMVEEIYADRRRSKSRDVPREWFE
jgi:prevent-host-death family protein